MELRLEKGPPPGVGGCSVFSWSSSGDDKSTSGEGDIAFLCLLYRSSSSSAADADDSDGEMMRFAAGRDSTTSGIGWCGVVVR